jgi:hypothetical protein
MVSAQGADGGRSDGRASGNAAGTTRAVPCAGDESMQRIRTFRAALAATATALVAAGALAAPAQATEAAEADWDVRVPVTVTTWFGTEREVTGTELAAIIKSPGLYRSYSVNLDKYETRWASTQSGATSHALFGVDNPPRELVQSFVAAVPNVESLATSAVLWGGCVKTTTYLSNPSAAGFATVHAGKYCK